MATSRFGRVLSPPNYYSFSRPQIASRRLFTTDPSTLTRAVQIYHSPSTNPFLNLSIEHHLLQHTHPDSTVLFLYANRPCVVIGRNQNPWLEVNLRQLRAGLPPSSLHAPHQREKIELVRRRSGGGTVFHDLGNMNWSVICPPAVFDRDRHAEMVTRALGRLGVEGVRVNERHDIVVDLNTLSHDPQHPPPKKTYKISGSAYKLTRLRSLHHGTCLLSSPNLDNISGLLRAPGEGFIKARGVESVRSKIRNVGVGNVEFVEAVVEEFRGLYGRAVEGIVLDEMAARGIEGIGKGVAELMSPGWIYGQTPQFTFSTHPTSDDHRPRPPLPDGIPAEFSAHLTIRHGEIQTASVKGLRYFDDIDAASQDQALSQALVTKRLHHITDWREVLQSASPSPIVDVEPIGRWLNTIFTIHR